VAFAAYNIDSQTAGVVLTDWIARLRGTAATAADYRWTFGVASLFAILNAAVRTWATAYLNADVMTAGQVRTSRLVADGPYRHVRNPLYLGNILLAIGFGAMASRIGCAILIVGMAVFVYRLILREEAGIAGSQGDAYRVYCAAVPRLLPALRPRLRAAGGVPNWVDGLLGEAFMWVLAMALVAFAVTLKQQIFFVVLASSFVVCAICYAIIKRRKKVDANPEQKPEGPSAQSKPQ
jgi:protein-S-isoprenylcysteine O-methyltransferase Ste14